MTATEIVREMMRREHISGISLSVQLGMSKHYLSRKLVQDNMYTNVFARICDILDYDVIVRNRSDGAEFYLSPEDN